MSKVQQLIALEREVIETRMAAARILLTMAEEVQRLSTKEAALERIQQLAEEDSPECARIGRLVVARAKADMLQGTL